jgi:Ca2+-binding EF-hand superfamily protein
MGCGAGQKEKSPDAGAASSAPASRLTDAELVKQAASTRLPGASITMNRSKAARRRRLLKEELMKRYDVSGQGTLTRDEVKAIMVKYEGDDFMPTDAQVEMVMRVGGDTCKPVLTQDQLVAAMAIVKAMADEEKQLDETFDKYDANKSGELDKGQLANLLKDLNDGEDVSQEDVELILEQADASGTDSILRAELKPAVMIWFSLREREDAEEAPAEKEKEAPTE